MTDELPCSCLCAQRADALRAEVERLRKDYDDAVAEACATGTERDEAKRIARELWPYADPDQDGPFCMHDSRVAEMPDWLVGS